jgi:uncharacterized protein (DUF111 family)
MVPRKDRASRTNRTIMVTDTTTTMSITGTNTIITTTPTRLTAHRLRLTATGMSVKLIAMIERAPLSPWVRERAVKAFTLLGEAEGRVHGLATADVPLHEVGAWDALVDIVGSIEGFEQLGSPKSSRVP